MRSQLTHMSAGTALTMMLAGRAEASTVEQFGDMLMNASPIIFLLVFTPCLFLYLILKSNYQKKVYLAAIEKGMSLPEKQNDNRKTALVLMALGAGFFLSTLILFTFVWITEPDQPPPPVAVCTLGFIPFLIGVALWKYEQMTANEKDGAKA